MEALKESLLDVGGGGGGGMCKCVWVIANQDPEPQKIWGELVVHRKSSQSWKPHLGMIEHGHHMDEWPFCGRLSG